MLKLAELIVVVMQDGGRALCSIAFAGSCTTAVVAYHLRRDFVMIELQSDYVKMGQKRLANAKEQFSLLEILK